MHVRSSLAGCLAALVSLAAAPPPRAVPEDLSGWSHYHTVKLVRKPGQDRYEFVLPAAVFGTARADLGDLRLVDARGRFIPYAVRVRQPGYENQPLPARIFDRLIHPDRSIQVSLDLGEPPSCCAILSVEIPGTVDLRALRVEGSDDCKDWDMILRSEYDFRPDERNAQRQPPERRRVAFRNARCRYLRVRWRPDQVVENDRLKLADVRVVSTEWVRGEEVRWAPSLGHREAVVYGGEKASQWLIDAGEPAVPCQSLIFQLDESDFARTCRLEVWRHGSFDPVDTRTLCRRPGKPGGVEVEIPFGEEVKARRLRLTLVDAKSGPSVIDEVRLSARARILIFALPPAVREPLRLYTGNPQAKPPRYDFAAGASARPHPLPIRLELGPAEDNPVYQPPPLTHDEPWPYQGDAVPPAAFAVLLLLPLLVLAWQALRRRTRRWLA